MSDERGAVHPRGRPDFFDDTEATANIGARVVRGGAFLVGASVARFILNLGATVILARLLTPEDYGLLAMVLVVTNFITLFQDMNLSLATVQQPKITHAQVSTIYWINITITLAIVAVIVVAAPGIAWFFDEGRLTAIAIVLCLAVMLRGAGSQHKALLRRKMQFGAIAIIETSSMFAGYVVAIVLAWNGYEYWSLVCLHIATTGTNTVMSWTYSGWRPGRPVRGSGVRPMLAFGGHMTGSVLLRYPARSLDRALIGWQTGAAPVGLYSKSFELIGPLTGYVTTPINTVAISALSRLVETPARYRAAFRRFTEAVAVITLPMSVTIICAAEDIVRLLLGAKWMAAAPILAILGILVFVEAMASCLQWLFISQGRGGHVLRYGAIDSVLRISAILTGMAWGVTGIAVAIALVAFFAQLPSQVWYACRTGPVRSIDFYSAILPVVVASAIAFGLIVLVRRHFPSDVPVTGILEAALIAGVLAIIALLVTPTGRDLWKRGWNVALNFINFNRATHK